MICQLLNPPQRSNPNPVQKAEPCPMENEARRLEDRAPVHVTVDLSGLDIHTVAQQGITENVSARGARVVTRKGVGGTVKG
jgi:hypothetical protein